MKASLLKIRGLRGFQAEREVPLSPNLTVVYGGNSRGKTSICEGWDWLFRGELLSDRPPQAELSDAEENIHADDDPLFELYDLDGDLLARRDPDGMVNPGGVPDETSPVMLQYDLQKVLYTQLRERREFFEDILDVTVESEFASNLRLACRNLSPYDLESWTNWEEALEPLTDEEFSPPYDEPQDSTQQEENEDELLDYLSDYFDCEPDVDALREVLEAPADTFDPGIEEISPPVDESTSQDIGSTLDRLDDIEAEAQEALARSTWRMEGVRFAEPPVCPFCREETIEEETLAEIQRDAEEVEQEHEAHQQAKSALRQTLQNVTPLIEVNVDETQDAIQEVLALLPSLGIDTEETHADRLNRLSERLDELEGSEFDMDDLEDPEVFEEVATILLGLSEAWIDLQPTLEQIRDELQERQTWIRHIRCAQDFSEYVEDDTEDLYRLLDSQEVLAEVAEVAPATLNDLKEERLEVLEDDIKRFYDILRPDDPTPLEEIGTSGEVRGDIRLRARSREQLEHASKVFGYSNANALGMAAHIARTLRAGHETIVLDDPFQSLDADNRKRVIKNLINTLLDEGLQVVLLTHDRDASQELLDRYIEKGVRGISLGWNSGEGPFPRPMYPNADQQLQLALDVFERDDPSEIQKAAVALRELLEHFCHSYLVEVGGGIPPTQRRNLGGYIQKLQALNSDIRPVPPRMQDLETWNETLSVEVHADGDDVPGMDQLKSIAREMLDAQGQERQLRPPDVEDWRTVPVSGGIAQRVSEILSTSGE